ncbi:restriction endonuclease [Candidatus Woesearchaeota archaeon]|nr:restriction endonuclease [Candidatus Woesearchaeota archaeon]
MVTIDEILLNLKIPSEFWPFLKKMDGLPEVIEELKKYSPEEVSFEGEKQKNWELIALFYRDTSRFYQAVQVISALYDKMCEHQVDSDERIHKGMPLVWLRDFHLGLGHYVIAKRYAMLTLCEDAITNNGSTNIKDTGIYYRLALEHGLSHNKIISYAEKFFEISQNFPDESKYPEWILQDVDNDWMRELPSSNEVYIYAPNKYYLKHLLDSLGEPSGKVLERFAEYILSVIPGFRTQRGVKTPSTDYDVVCGIEGTIIDFRTELGRYIIGECKDWSKPVDFSAIAKFCRVLDSAKCKSGIIFSKKGISGEDKLRNAEREQLKVFHDRDIAILVLNLNDLKDITEGENLIALLRKKYEKVRLDIVESKSATP